MFMVSTTMIVFHCYSCLLWIVRH